MSYAGEIYDGPLMGEYQEYEETEFMVLLPVGEDERGTILRAYNYRWLESLNAWCFEY